jgi:hypothetical protein
VDWKRKKYEYPTAFDGEQYHMIKNKNQPGFTILPNNLDPNKSRPAPPGPSFEK